MIELARTYRELQAMIKELEAEADALKQSMINEMDEAKADTMTAGEYTIRYSLCGDDARTNAAGTWNR